MKWYAERLDDAIAAGVVWRTGSRNVRVTACFICKSVVGVGLGRPIKFQRRRIGTACGHCFPAFPTATEARKIRVKKEGGSSHEHG